MTLTTQKTLQFLIDNICADFTVDKLLGTARECLAAGPCTLADISAAIRRKDPSLDKGCADGSQNHEQINVNGAIAQRFNATL